MKEATAPPPRRGGVRRGRGDAPGGDDATDRGADAARDVDVGASDRAGAAPGATTPAASAAAPTAARVAGVSRRRPRAESSGKLRAKMATHPDVPMPGALRYEGKKRKASGSGDGAEGDRGVRRASSGGIGHLMKPSRGATIDSRVASTRTQAPKVRPGKTDGGEEAEEEQESQRAGETPGGVIAATSGGGARTDDDPARPPPLRDPPPRRQCLLNRDRRPRPSWKMEVSPPEHHSPLDRLLRPPPPPLVVRRPPLRFPQLLHPHRASSRGAPPRARTPPTRRAPRSAPPRASTCAFPSTAPSPRAADNRELGRDPPSARYSIRVDLLEGPPPPPTPPSRSAAPFPAKRSSRRSDAHPEIFSSIAYRSAYSVEARWPPKRAYSSTRARVLVSSLRSSSSVARSARESTAMPARRVHVRRRHVEPQPREGRAAVARVHRRDVLPCDRASRELSLPSSKTSSGRRRCRRRGGPLVRLGRVDDRAAERERGVEDAVGGARRRRRSRRSRRVRLRRVVRLEGALDACRARGLERGLARGVVDVAAPPPPPALATSMTVAFPSLCAHCEASERPDSSTVMPESIGVSCRSPRRRLDEIHEPAHGRVRVVAREVERVLRLPVPHLHARQAGHRARGERRAVSAPRREECRGL